jgi:hypothetical protein
MTGGCRNGDLQLRLSGSGAADQDQIAFGLREGSGQHIRLGQCRIQRRLSSCRFLMPLSRRHSLVPDHAYPSGSGSDLSLRQRASGRISPDITLVILCWLALVVTVMHAHP